MLLGHVISPQLGFISNVSAILLGRAAILLSGARHWRQRLLWFTRFLGLPSVVLDFVLLDSVLIQFCRG